MKLQHIYLMLAVVSTKFIHFKIFEYLFKFTLLVCFSLRMQATPDPILAFEKHEVVDQHQSDNDNVLLLYPHLSLYKHQTIDLVSQNSDTLFLNFSSLPQESFVNHLLYGGKFVGHVTTDDNSFRFVAEVEQPYNFSLISPVTTGFFSIQTHSKFIFQKAVQAQLAALVCNSVAFYDLFKSKQHLLVQAHDLDNYSYINCLNFKFDGISLKIMPQDLLDVQEIVDFSGLKSFVNDGQILFGQNARIFTDVFDNCGIFRTGISDGFMHDNSLFVRANFIYNSGNIHAQNADVNADRLLYNTGNFVADNNLTINALASLNSCSLQRFHKILTSSFDWEYARKIFNNPAMLLKVENWGSFVGVMRAKNLSINSGFNLNIGGMYQAYNRKINSLVTCNAGLYVPQLKL